MIVPRNSVKAGGISRLSSISSVSAILVAPNLNSNLQACRAGLLLTSLRDVSASVLVCALKIHRHDRHCSLFKLGRFEILQNRILDSICIKQNCGFPCCTVCDVPAPFLPPAVCQYQTHIYLQPMDQFCKEFFAGFWSDWSINMPHDETFEDKGANCVKMVGTHL